MVWSYLKYNFDHCIYGRRVPGPRSEGAWCGATATLGCRSRPRTPRPAPAAPPRSTKPL